MRNCYPDDAIVCTLLQKRGSTVDMVEDDACIPLHMAAQEGHLAVRVATVDVIDGDGRTPLHLAAQEGHVDVVDALVGQGATVE